MAGCENVYVVIRALTANTDKMMCTCRSSNTELFLKALSSTPTTVVDGRQPQLHSSIPVNSCQRLHPESSDHVSASCML